MGSFPAPLLKELPPQNQAGKKKKINAQLKKSPSALPIRIPDFHKCHFLQEALGVGQGLMFTPLTHHTFPWRQSPTGEGFSPGD